MRSEVIRKRAIVEIPIDYQYDDTLDNEPHAIKYGGSVVTGRTYDEALDKLQAILLPTGNTGQ